MLSLIGAVVLAASTGAVETSSTPANDPVVCKTAKVPVVGTRMKPPPVCRRKSEWDEERRLTQRELQQINERGNNPGRADGR